MAWSLGSPSENGGARDSTNGTTKLHETAKHAFICSISINVNYMQHGHNQFDPTRPLLTARLLANTLGK